jgi:hypothetical protein
MGQRIWAVLEEYAGQWVSVDKSGRVLDCAETLPELKRRAGNEAPSLTFVFASRATS